MLKVVRFLFPILFCLVPFVYPSYTLVCPCCSSFCSFSFICIDALLLFAYVCQFLCSSCLLFRVTEEVVNEGEKNLGAEKPVGEEDVADGNKENPVNEPEEKEPEEKVNGSMI